MLEEHSSDLMEPILDPIWRPPISCGFLMCSLLSGISTGVLTGLLGWSVVNIMSGLEALHIVLGAGLLGALFHAFDYRYGFFVNGFDAEILWSYCYRPCLVPCCSGFYSDYELYCAESFVCIH